MVTPDGHLDVVAVASLARFPIARGVLAVDGHDLESAG